MDLHISNIKLNFVHASTYTHGQNQCLNTQEIADTELRILYKIIELQERGYDVMEHNIFIKLKTCCFANMRIYVFLVVVVVGKNDCI